ncbi:MAG: flippase, partial [Candidatus Margulisiibacteriota bacterium]
MEVSVTKRMAKNFTWLSVGSIISRGLNFFAQVYVARVLGAAAFGLLNFALAFQTYLVLVVDSGLSLLGVREIAKAKERAGAISLNIFAIRFILALIVFLVALLVLYFLPLSSSMRWLFIAAFSYIFYRALNADWVFQGLERMDQVAIANVLYSLVVFSLMVAMVRSALDLIKVPIILTLVGVGVSLVFLGLLFKRFAPTTLEHLAPTYWWDYFQEAIPLGASVILIQIYYNLDTIMLGFMDRPEVVGWYNAAYKIFLVLVGFLGLWQSTAFPVVSRRIIEDRERTITFLNKYARLTLLVVVPLVLLITFLAPWIIKLFYGVEYQSSSIALQMLVWSTLLIVIFGIYGILVMIPLGRSKEFLYGVGSGAVVNVILNFILIPRFSFIGAAVATILSEVMVTVVMFFLIQREIQIEILKNFRVPVVASAIASFFFFA